MAEEYKFREYEKGDESQIVELLEQVFPQWPPFDLKCSPLNHWKWKYFGSGTGNTIAICEKDNEIVACDHEQVKLTKIGDNNILCSHGCDSAVHPEHRRKGLYTKTNEFKEDLATSNNIGMSYFTTGEPAMIEYIKKKGVPYFPIPINLFIRFQDVDKYNFQQGVNNLWLKKQGYKFLRNIKKVNNLTGKEASFDFCIKNIEIFDDRIDLFWEKVSPSLNFAVQRSQNYMNWRYCDSRGGDYIIRQAEMDGEVLGFSIHRINRRMPDDPIGYIVDQLVLPGRNDVFDALSRSAVEYFDKSNVNVSMVWVVNGHPYTRLYEKYGFLNTRSDRNLFYHVENTDDSILKFISSKPEQIHFQIGDIDEI